MRRIYIYIVLLFVCANAFAQKPKTQDIEIEFEGEKYIIEDVFFRRVGDDLRIELGDIKVAGDEKNSKRFVLPFLMTAESRQAARERNSVNRDDFAGVLEVYPERMTEKDGELYIDLLVHLDRDVMNRRQSWLIIPELYDDVNSVTYSGLLINGEIKSTLFRRRIRFRNRDLINNPPDMVFSVEESSDTLVKYRIRKPFEPWMEGATLRLHQVLGSPAKKEQLFTVHNAGQVFTGLESSRAIQVTSTQPTISSYIIPDARDKRRSIQNSAYLEFHQGKSLLDPSFRNNPAELQKINGMMSSILEDQDITLLGVNLCGYASPEGSWSINERLSLNRALALKEYIQGIFYLEEGRFRVSNVPEDWETLRELVANSSIAEKYEIIDIIDNTDIFGSPSREQLLMQLAGGRPWKFMLMELFPELRRVEIECEAEYVIRDYSLREIREIFNRDAEKLDLYELCTLISTLDLYDALMMQVLDVMILRYPDHPVAILNYGTYLLQTGNTAGAIRFLDRIASDPRAANNLGVYWFLMDDFEKAEGYFRKAQSAGYDVKNNLQLIENKR